MVAEPVTEKEISTSPVEDVESPELTSQPVAEPEVDDVPEDAVSAFLKEQKILGEGSEDSAGAEPKTDEVGPDLSKLTPAQILELGKQQGKSETLTEAQSQAARYNQELRINGARNKILSVQNEDIQRSYQDGRDPQAVQRFWNDLWGDFNQVYQGAYSEIRPQVQAEFQQATRVLAVEALGTAKGKSFVSEWNALPPDQQSSAKFFSMYAEKASEGKLTAAEVEKKVSTAIRDFIKKMPKEARDAIGFNPSTTKTGTSSSGGANLSYQQLLKNPKLIDGLTGEQWEAIVAKG